MEQNCKDCQVPFTLSEMEIVHFQSLRDKDGNPLSTPKRCKECRRKRRAEREKNEGNN